LTPDGNARVFELEGGGTVTIVSGQSGGVELQSSRPFPPGSTLVFRDSNGGGSVRVKVRGSRLVGDTASARPFRVEGRFVDLTKEQRTLLFPPS